MSLFSPSKRTCSLTVPSPGGSRIDKRRLPQQLGGSRRLLSSPTRAARLYQSESLETLPEHCRLKHPRLRTGSHEDTAGGGAASPNGLRMRSYSNGTGATSGTSLLPNKTKIPSIGQGYLYCRHNPLSFKNILLEYLPSFEHF